MKIRADILLLLCVAGVAGRTAIASGEHAPTVVFLVRHAEKIDESRDPPLSKAGKQRAEALAHMLQTTRFSRIMSTDFKRTRDTVTAVADRCGKELSIYDPRKLYDELISAEPGATILVAGHSNTIPELIRQFGLDYNAKLLEGYDDLFLLLIYGDGTGDRSAMLHRLQYPPTALDRAASRTR